MQKENASPEEQSRPHVLVFDDNAPTLRLLHRILSDRFQVDSFERVEEGLHLIESVDVIISDFEMPGLGGAGLLELLARQRCSTPVLIISGLSPRDILLKGVRESGVPLLSKPFLPAELLKQAQILATIAADSSLCRK